VKTGTVVLVVVAVAAAIAAFGLLRRSSPVDGVDAGVSESRASEVPAPPSAPPSSTATNAGTTPSAPRATDPAWRTPSSPSPRYAEPEEIESQLGQFFAQQTGVAITSLSSIECGATYCEIALTGPDANPRYVDAQADVHDRLVRTAWKDFRILGSSLGTREIAPGAREYVLGFEYQPLVELSAEPLIAARQYAACAAAWRRQTENPTPDHIARDYLDRAERYVALAASVLGEAEAAQVAAETRGGPLIRECGLSRAPD
jgi:hypothetical protein